MNNKEVQILKRIPFIDVAKALGMYLVILGHLVIFNYKEFRFIFAFHMPLFFIISGFTTGIKREQSFAIFIRKQFRHYIIPYSLALLFSILQMILVPQDGRDFQRLISRETVINLYEGYFIFSYFSSAWFLICLFWAQLFFFFLLKIKDKVKKYLYTLIWIVWVIIALFSKEIFSLVPVFRRLPLKMDSAIMASVFIGLGYLLSKGYAILKKKRTVLLLISVVSILIGFPGVYYVSCKGNTYVNIADLVYAIEWRYLLGAILGSIAILGLSFILEKAVFLANIGKYTLVILLVHEVVYTFLIAIFNKMFRLSLYPMGMRFDYICILISILTYLISLLIAVMYYHVLNWLKTNYEETKR